MARRKGAPLIVRELGRRVDTGSRVRPRSSGAFIDDWTTRASRRRAPSTRIQAVYNARLKVRAPPATEIAQSFD